MNALLQSLCLMLLGLVTITLAAPIGQSQPLRHRGRRPETKEEMKTYLNRFGHYHSRSGNRTTNRTDEDLKSALRTFQTFFKLNVTGEANNETMELMGTPRCGVSDRRNNDSNTVRRKRFATFGTKWPRLRLTYLFQNYTPDLPVDGTRSAIQLALKDWSDVAPFTFIESQTTSANIKFLFARLDHGDGNSFDGRGDVLAHAYAPTNGNTHFDEDEDWTNSALGTNLRQVATHELGHALGLDHSDDKNAVMFPYYRYREKFALNTDDIKGIRSLYGARPLTPDTASSPRSSSSSVSTPRSSTISSKSSSASSTTGSSASTTGKSTSSTSSSSTITSKSSSAAFTTGPSTSTTSLPTRSTLRSSIITSKSLSAASTTGSSTSTTRIPTSSTSRSSTITSKSFSAAYTTRFPTSTSRQPASSTPMIPKMTKSAGCPWYLNLLGRC